MRGQALLLAAGERLDQAVALLAQIDERDEVVGRDGARVIGSEQAQDLAHGQPGIELALLQGDTDALLEGRAGRGRIEAAHGHASGVGLP